MIKWMRRLLLLASLAVGFSVAASACSSPTAPRIPDGEEPTDTIPPGDS